MEINLNENDVRDIKNETTKKGKCTTCNKPLSKSQKMILFLSFYIIGTAIYGNIKLIEKIINLF